MDEPTPSSAAAADVIRRLDELQGEVADLRDRIEQMRTDSQDRRYPDRHRKQTPYLAASPDGHNFSR